MPVHRGKDATGCYYQWGDHGKKYYYECNNKESREEAKQKAALQGRAAYSHGYRKT
jgi:hypothetical protein